MENSSVTVYSLFKRTNCPKFNNFSKRLGATVKELTAIADNETTTVEFEKVYEVYFEDANEVGIYAPEGELLDWRVANDSDKGNLFSGVAVLGEKATASAA